MDNEGLYKGITDFKSMQLYAEIKADIAATMADLKMIKKKASERRGDKLLNGNQVMDILKIKKGTLQKFRNKNILSFVRLSGKICYKSTDVDALLNSNYIKKPPRRAKKYQGADH